jgi:drug/metabolite transporter (DMT)-like permease
VSEAEHEEGLITGPGFPFFINKNCYIQQTMKAHTIMMYFSNHIPMKKIVKTDFQKGILFASFTALLWGFLAIVLKISLKNCSPVEITWLRFTIAFVILGVYLLIRNPSSFGIFLRPPPLLIFAGICLGFNYLGFITGIHFTTPGIAQIFIQTGPVLLALSGFLFFKEKASLRQIIGLFLVFGGLAVFYHNQIIMFAENINRYQRGVLWTVFGAIMWAAYAVFQKQLVKAYSPLELNLVLFGLPAIGYFPFVDFQIIKSASAIEWGLFLFLGCNTLLAYGSLANAFQFLEANKVSVIITLNPIITISVMSILALLNVDWIVHEKFTLVSFAGASLVIFGAILTILKKRREK